MLPHTHARAHMHTHTHTHTYMHIHTQTHKHAYTHIYSHPRTYPIACNSCRDSCNRLNSKYGGQCSKGLVTTTQQQTRVHSQFIQHLQSFQPDVMLLTSLANKISVHAHTVTHDITLSFCLLDSNLCVIMQWSTQRKMHMHHHNFFHTLFTTGHPSVHTTNYTILTVIHSYI